MGLELRYNEWLNPEAEQIGRGWVLGMGGIVIGDSKPSAEEEMKRTLERSKNRTWSADRKRLLELIEAL